MESLKLAPERIEPVLRPLIENARPELHGCTLRYFGYDPARMEFEIGVQHGCLEWVAEGSVAPRFPLLKQKPNDTLQLRPEDPQF